MFLPPICKIISPADEIQSLCVSLTLYCMCLLNHGVWSQVCLSPTHINLSTTQICYFSVRLSPLFGPSSLGLMSASLVFGWMVEDVVDGWEDTPDKAWLLNIRSGGGLGG